MKRPHRDWVELRWWDAALVVALAAALVMCGWAERYAPTAEPLAAEEAADPPPCEKGTNGDCGCIPTYPPCSMPCQGCCPGGRKSPPPNPTHSHEH